MGFNFRTRPLEFGIASSLVYGAGFMKHEIVLAETRTGFWGPRTREEILAKVTHFPPVAATDGSLTEMVTVYVYSPRILAVVYSFADNWRGKYGEDTTRIVRM